MTVPDDISSAMEVHRLLDEAFAGIEMTPERQDLKEEVRGNLVARVAELRGEGVPGGEAARRAVGELGDVRELAAGLEPATWQQMQVRPRPAFVLRTVLFSVAGAAGLGALAITGLPIGARVAALLVVAAAAGLITADALVQETTGDHPMPAGRARGYGAGTLLAVAGLGLGWLGVSGSGLAHLGFRAAGAGWFVGGVVPVLAAIGLLSYLGATQTNRQKEWVLRMRREQGPDRFTQDPAAAARFGVYTVVNWLVALAGFVVLALTVGWAWSWLALVGGVAVMMLMIARMLFVPPQD